MTVVSVSAVENVASVEVLPVPIPIVNERRKAMKKLMMAVGVWNGTGGIKPCGGKRKE